jgi:hypothetical protein
LAKRGETIFWQGKRGGASIFCGPFWKFTPPEVHIIIAPPLNARVPTTHRQINARVPTGERVKGYSKGGLETGEM